MSDPNFGEENTYIEGEDPIQCEEWIDFANGLENLHEMEPLKLKNPFNGKIVISNRRSAFWVKKDGKKVGSLVWWSSEVVGVNGNRHDFAHEIQQVCDRFKGKVVTVDH